MKAKTLLIAAAALAAGVISSQAQTPVYSQNIVGYYNVTIPAGHQFLTGNQLLNSDGTNGVSNVYGSGNLVSQSTILYSWNGLTFIPYTYYSAADAAPSPAGYYDGNGIAATATSVPGVGAFLSNPSGAPITITVVGSVVQGSVTNSFPTGFSPLAIVQPIGTNIDSSIVGLTPSAASQNINYYHWNNNAQGYDAPLTYYSAADAAPSPAGWYDGNGTLQSTNASYWPNVGEGFFVNNSSGQPITWTSSFTAQ